MIENWLTNEEIGACKGAAIDDRNEVLYDTNVRPYLDMTLKGWVYYQGENNCNGLHGNSGTKTQPASGYACMMPRLVSFYRKLWSKQPGTTDPKAAFGVVSLSSHDSEGAKDMGSFRWAQQGAYGTVHNNPVMENTFMAHGFDMQDPWNSNKGACITNSGRALMKGYDCTTPWYMGPSIHPRLKKPVGQRLALGALHVAHGQGGGAVGGVIRGCSLEPSASSLTLKFTMPGDRKLTVKQYNQSNPSLSATAVQVNASTTWLPAHIALGSAAGTITVKLPAGVASGSVTAVRYAWGTTNAADDGGAIPNGKDITCCEGNGDDAPCVPAQCPLLAAEPLAPFGGLPIDPFLAKVVGGKCLCPEPQVCAD